MTSVHPATRRVAERGFTLIEVMIVLALLAVFSAIAVPAFSSMTLTSKLRAQANALSAGVVLARSEAIKRNQVVRLCATDDGATCSGDVGSWGNGWIVLSAGNEVISRQTAMPEGFLNIATAATLSFQPSGVGATVVTFTLCRATPSVGGQEREVAVSATGRPSVKKTYTATCSSS